MDAKYLFVSVLLIICILDSQAQCVNGDPDCDNDGICDAQDICPNVDDALIGMPCSDGDPCTSNDIWKNNCNCEGTPLPDSDKDGFCDAIDICVNFDDAVDIDDDGIPYCIDQCIDINDNDVCDDVDTESLDKKLKIYFSHKRGFYSGAFPLSMVPNKPGATIRYFIGNDPQIPSQSIGQIFNGSITVNQANTFPNLLSNDAIVTVKAIAYTANEMSKVYTHSYLFFDPKNTDVVVLTDGIQPVGTTNDDDHISFEFLAYPGSSLKSVQEYGGVRHKDPTTYNAKDSPKIFFRGEYDAPTLKADLFSDKYDKLDVIQATEKFDQLYLRYGHLGDPGIYRSTLYHDLFLDTGNLAPHTKYVIYIYHGAVHGIRQLKERPEGGYMESYFGADKSDYAESTYATIVDMYGSGGPGAQNHRPFPPVDVLSNYDSLMNYHYDLSNAFTFDYMLNVGGDRQWFQYRMVYPIIPNSPEGARTLFYEWDTDAMDGELDDFHDATQMFTHMNTDMDFISAYNDQFACLCMDEKALAPALWMNKMGQIKAKRDEAYSAIQGYAPQGDVASVPPPSLSKLLASRDLMISHLQNNNAMLTMPVDFVTSGGIIKITDPVIMSNPNSFGQIYYTTDGTDPRLSNGGLNPGAILYSGPFNLTSGVYTIKARVYDPSNSDPFAKWSGSCPELFYVDIHQIPYKDIVINELHYNPNDEIIFNPRINAMDTVGGKNFEFIELKNNGQSAIPLAGSRFSNGVNLYIGENIMIQADSFVVFAQDEFWFEQKYGFAPDGEYSGNLDNGGEKLNLKNPKNYFIDTLRYNDKSPWPSTADKGYYSMALVNASLDNSDPENWSIQSVFTTPRAENYFINFGDHGYSGIVINEIHYNPFDSIDNSGSIPDTINGEKFEFIELKNISNAPIDLSGSFFARGIDYEFENNVSIQPQEFIVLAEDKSSFEDRYGFPPFDKYDGKLSNGGESIWLNSSTGILLDAVTYDDNFPWDTQPDGGNTDLSLALIDPNVDNDIRLNWKAQCTQNFTPNQENDFSCFLGFNYNGLIINEIHYAPDGGDVLEFIEIVNTNQSNLISLLGIALTSNGIPMFVFDEVYLPPQPAYPQNFIVICQDSAAFHDAYGFEAHGEYDGNLSNGGENLVLQDLFTNVIDQVHYDEQPPWDTSAFLSGHSLALKSLTIDNSLANSWSVQNVNVTPGELNTFDDCPVSDFDLSHPLIVQNKSVSGFIINNGTINAPNTIEFAAGQSIELVTQFKVSVGSTFHAYISTCN